MKTPLYPSKELLEKELLITLPVPPSVNHLYFTARNGMRIITKKGKEWFSIAENIIQKEIKKQGWNFVENTLIVAELMVYWRNLITRDTNNLDKVICDALEGYVLNNDCYLLTRYINWKIDRETPRIEMVIRAFNPKVDDWKHEEKFKEI